MTEAPVQTPQKMAITREIAASLSAAGIGKLYHDKTLADHSPLGARYDAWVRKRGPSLARDGGLVVFTGLGQHTELRLLARAFHLNGAGVRVKTLPQIVLAFRKGGEMLEEMNDAPVLFVSPAQASRRVCPLEPWDQDVVTEYMRTRVERGQVVLLHWDSDQPMTVTDPLYQWYDDGWLQWVMSTGTVIRRTDMMTGK